jgi:hypothetical protein
MIQPPMKLPDKDAARTRAELRIPVAEQEAHPSPAFLQRQQQVAGLLGQPRRRRVGGHPGQVDPTGIQLDEEQHVQPAQRARGKARLMAASTARSAGSSLGRLVWRRSTAS